MSCSKFYQVAPKSKVAPNSKSCQKDAPNSKSCQKGVEQLVADATLGLATRAGKMALSFLLGISRCVPKENSVTLTRKNRINIQPSGPQAWSITHINIDLYNNKLE